MLSKGIHIWSRHVRLELLKLDAVAHPELSRFCPHPTAPNPPRPYPKSPNPKPMILNLLTRASLVSVRNPKPQTQSPLSPNASPCSAQGEEPAVPPRPVSFQATLSLSLIFPSSLSLSLSLPPLSLPSLSFFFFSLSLAHRSLSLIHAHAWYIAPKSLAFA